MVFFVVGLTFFENVLDFFFGRCFCCWGHSFYSIVFGPMKNPSLWSFVKESVSFCVRDGFILSSLRMFFCSRGLKELFVPFTSILSRMLNVLSISLKSFLNVLTSSSVSSRCARVAIFWMSSVSIFMVRCGLCLVGRVRSLLCFLC